MSKLEEIELAAAKLPLNEFLELAVWIDSRRQVLKESSTQIGSKNDPFRDHTAFLNSYSPEDEGLYDDASPR
jgi:hypothetical protein